MNDTTNECDYNIHDRWSFASFALRYDGLYLNESGNIFGEMGGWFTYF